MKKQFLSIGKVLSRNEQKEIFGGSMNDEDEGGTHSWVSCKDGTTYPALNCGLSADNMCVLNGGFSSCSTWPN